MILIKRLFAEKTLNHIEMKEKFLAVIRKFIGNKEILNNKILIEVLGVIAQIGCLFVEFLKKLLFVVVFMLLPYRIMSGHFPLIAEQKELTITFMFFVICVVCGSITNNVVSIVNKRDYMMTRAILISAKIHNIGKLIYRMIGDLLFFTLALLIVGLPFAKSFCLALLAMLSRPLGEVIIIFIYERMKLIYKNKGGLYGVCMALSMVIAYGCPMYFRKIDEAWNYVTNPVVLIMMFIICVCSFGVMCNYRNYSGIIRDTHN